MLIRADIIQEEQSSSLMANSLELKTSMVVRRDPVKLPSVVMHILLALIFLFVIAAATVAMIRNYGQPDDAIAGGRIAVQALPTPVAAGTLDSQSGVLPDLLAGVVPVGANPTEGGFDALGNASLDTALSDASFNEESRIQDGGLAGGARSDIQEGPQTFLIDGQAVNLNASALIKAPIQGLTRRTPFGLVPGPATDGRLPVTAYARPFVVPTAQRPVSLIIGGLGINSALTSRAIAELPANITLSFAAHSTGLQEWIDQARAAGHEVLLEVPMETNVFDVTEKGAERAMMATSDAARNIRNLDWLMSRAHGYFGLTNYNGDKFLLRTDAVAPVMKHISNAGLGFIFDGAFSAPSLETVATTTDLPFHTAFTLIDQTPKRAAINAQLDRLKAQALNADVVTPVAIGFAFPDTLDAVIAWSRQIETDNIILAPASHAMLNSDSLTP